MGLMRKEKTESKFKIVVALVLAVSLLCAPVVKVDAWKTYKTKATSKKTDAKKKEASVYSVKENAVDIKLDGYKNKQDIVLSFYEKQDNGQYRKIKTAKKKDVKDDTFKFKQVLNEKSDFDYGKTYKYKITSKEYYVEQKDLSEYLNPDFDMPLGNKNGFLKTSDKKLSDGDKVNFKNYGKLLTFKHKKSKDAKTFKVITKKKRLLEFSRKYKKYTYSQAKRHQEGFADCSSFVYACYKDIGMNLGGDGANTETELKWCEHNALKVKIGSAKLGDVIFYSDEGIDTFEDHYKHVTHVAMFKDNKTIMEMSGEGVDFRTRTVSARDHDCIAVYRPIFDSKDMVDKDPHKQNLKKSKKEKEEDKFLKKTLKQRKKKEKEEKAKKKKKKKKPVKVKEEETAAEIEAEEETDEQSAW